MKLSRRLALGAAVGTALTIAASGVAFADYDVVTCYGNCTTTAIAAHSSQHWIRWAVLSDGDTCEIRVRDIQNGAVVQYASVSGDGNDKNGTTYGLYGRDRAEGTGNKCAVGISNYTDPASALRAGKQPQ
jgi:hypothetical protein